MDFETLQVLHDNPSALLSSLGGGSGSEEEDLEEEALTIGSAGLRTINQHEAIRTDRRMD